MRTTINIESDEHPATVASEEATAQSTVEDAGAAPVTGSTVDTAHDGGEPPAWLFDAISDAGGGVTPGRTGTTDGVTVHDAGAGPSA